jgi:hypothetical protein
MGLIIFLMKSNVNSDRKKKRFFSYYRKKVFDESNDVCVMIEPSIYYIQALNKKK